MKKSSNVKTVQSKQVASKDELKNKKNSIKKKTSVGPEEFEEDQSMNIRMKPQPLGQQGASGKK